MMREAIQMGHAYRAIDEPHIGQFYWRSPSTIDSRLQQPERLLR